MNLVRLLCSAALAAGLAAPATAQLPPPRPDPSAGLLIRLAVAEARCTGSHQKMVARYRPAVLRKHAADLRTIGQAMMTRYRAAHGEDWRLALDADMTAMRTQFERDADQPGFCKQAAIEARDLSGEIESSAGRFRNPANVESDFILRADRIR